MFVKYLALGVKILIIKLIFNSKNNYLQSTRKLH